MEKLAAPTQEFLLLAAADPVGDPGILARAAAVLGITERTPKRLRAPASLRLAASYGSAIPWRGQPCTGQCRLLDAGEYMRPRAFRVENLVLGIAMLVGIPVYFFASEYAQVALGKPPIDASLVLLYFFIGFVVAAQIGGRMLDRVGAKRPVVLGCVLAAVGFALWAGKATDLSLSSQIWFIVLAGAGMGLMQGQANTDAVNRASRLSYGEATGITQTVRNYGASLGLAVLGTILVSGLRSRLTSSLVAKGLAPGQAAAKASRIAEHQGGTGSATTIPHFVRLDFAYASQSVFYVMAGIMAAATVAALLGLRAGLSTGAPRGRRRRDRSDVGPGRRAGPGLGGPMGGRRLRSRTAGGGRQRPRPERPLH